MKVVWVLMVATEDEAACSGAVTGDTQFEVVLGECCQVLTQRMGLPRQRHNQTL